MGPPGKSHDFFFCLKIFRCIVLSVTLPSTEASFVAQTVKLLTTMAIHSSTIAWKIPWTEEPGRLQSMGSKRVGHD